jgi:hypothetical protein
MYLEPKGGPVLKVDRIEVTSLREESSVSFRVLEPGDLVSPDVVPRKLPLVAIGELTLMSSYLPPQTRDHSPVPLFQSTSADRDEDRYLVLFEWETNDGEYGSGSAVETPAPEGPAWLFVDAENELILRVRAGQPPRYWVFARHLIDCDVQLQVQDRWSGASWTYGNRS